MNLYAFLREGFAPRVGHPALDAARNERSTYADLARESARIAGLLRAEGVQRGAQVAVGVERPAQAAAMLLGCWRAGAVAVIEPGRGRVLEVDPTLPTHFEPIVTRDEEIAAVLPAAGGLDGVAGIAYSHGALARATRSAIGAFGLAPDDVVLAPAAWLDATNLVLGLLAPLRVGARVLAPRKGDAKSLAKALAGASVFVASAEHVERLLEDDKLAADRVARLRRMIAIGNAPREEVASAWAERTGIAPARVFSLPDSPFVAATVDTETVTAGALGMPWPRVQLRVLDAEGKPRKLGADGRLAVRSDFAASALIGADGATIALPMDAEGHLDTGLGARLEEDGSLTMLALDGAPAIAEPAVEAAAIGETAAADSPTPIAEE